MLRLTQVSDIKLILVHTLRTDHSDYASDYGNPIILIT